MQTPIAVSLFLSFLLQKYFLYLTVSSRFLTTHTWNATSFLPQGIFNQIEGMYNCGEIIDRSCNKSTFTIYSKLFQIILYFKNKELSKSSTIASNGGKVFPWNLSKCSVGRDVAPSQLVQEVCASGAWAQFLPLLLLHPLLHLPWQVY